MLNNTTIPIFVHFQENSQSFTFTIFFEQSDNSLLAGLPVKNEKCALASLLKSQPIIVSAHPCNVLFWTLAMYIIHKYYFPFDYIYWGSSNKIKNYSNRDLDFSQDFSLLLLLQDITIGKFKYTVIWGLEINAMAGEMPSLVTEIA